MKKESRRGFIKKAVTYSVAASVAGEVIFSERAMAQNQEEGDNGVVRGYSPKKEVLYRLTKHWEEYYKVAP